MPSRPSTGDAVDRLLAGDRRALARVITRVENGDEAGRQALERLYPQGGRAQVVGVTGPPGAGKSTLIGALVGVLRARKRRVAVVAIDPTSPLTGGATLGDRIRMGAWHADDDVFVRSMASRGHAGGLAKATAGVIQVLDAAGFDPILVETVGGGQGDTEIAGLAHTAVLVQVPGAGDDVQTLKAGTLEVGDVLVVNKGDLPGADGVVSDLQALRSLAEPAVGTTGAGDWTVPVLKVSAATGGGVEDLADVIDRHRRHLLETGGWSDRDRARAAAGVSAHLRALLEAEARSALGSPEVEAALDALAARTMTPERALEAAVSTLSRRLRARVHAG